MFYSELIDEWIKMEDDAPIIYGLEFQVSDCSSVSHR